MTETPHHVVHALGADPLARQSLQSTMDSAQLSFHAYASTEEFLEQCAPDFAHGCLLLDSPTPDTAGEEVLAALRARRIHMPVIVISASVDVQAAVRVMKCGASDFLQKPFASEVLVSRVRELLAQTLVHQADSRDAAAAREKLARLSDRERDVFRLVVRGLPHKLIAAELGISVRTVDHHRASLNGKLEANNLADVVRVGLLAGVE